MSSRLRWCDCALCRRCRRIRPLKVLFGVLPASLWSSCAHSSVMTAAGDAVVDIRVMAAVLQIQCSAEHPAQRSLDAVWPASRRCPAAEEAAEREVQGKGIDGSWQTGGASVKHTVPKAAAEPAAAAAVVRSTSLRVAAHSSGCVAPQ